MSRRPITTELQLKALKAEAKPYNVSFSNIPGLYVTVGKKSKTFKYDRGAGFKPRGVTYGRFPTLSIADARKLHEETQLQHQNGTLGMANTNSPKTVKDLAELFYTSEIHSQLKRPDAVRRVLDKDIIPVIGTMPLQAVNVMICRDVVDKVVKRGATVYAARVFSVLGQMLNFAVSYNFIGNNPTASLKPDSLGIESNVKKRVLSDDELAVFWQALNQKKSTTTRVGLQLLMLLGLRSGELRLAKWSDVDSDNKTLTIPVENQKLKRKQIKTAKPFVVPLSAFAFELLESLRDFDAVHIFVGNKAGKPAGEKIFNATVTRMLENMHEMKDIEHFTPHDLRRTLRTKLSELGVDFLVAEKCLNHSLGRIAQTYDHHDYLDERRATLKLWSDRVEQLTGSNVVQLRRSAWVMKH